jgi:hypothetical protein
LKAGQAKAEEPKPEPPDDEEPGSDPAQKQEPGKEPQKRKGKRGKRGKSKLQKAQDALKKLETDCLPRQKKYEDQERKLAGRNSYSKTDVDATFMRMKDDHMRNGQLKPGYNLQVGTENQFVVGFSVHQRAGDPGCLIPHLNKLKENLGCLPKNVIADSAYGSEENYAFLIQEGLGNYLKYNNFRKEQRPRYKPNPFAVDQLKYDPDKDELICPAEKRRMYRYTARLKTDNGFRVERRMYEAEDCQGCALKAQCSRAKGNRWVRISFRLQEWRQQAQQNLTSEKGKRLRSLRGVEVEGVFGRLKEDWGFRRFLLKGLDNVKTEWGLLCMAHNFAKVAVQ